MTLLGWIVVAAVLEGAAIVGILWLIATAPLVTEGGVHDAVPRRRADRMPEPLRLALVEAMDAPALDEDMLRHLTIVSAPPPRQTLIDAEALGWLEGA